MTSFLQQLENNEAVLLMYMADELPAEDRAEVEQLLATDAGLRTTLENLTGMQHQVMSGLAALDKAHAPLVSEVTAVRQVASAITRWHLEPHAAPPARPVQVRGLRLIPWWTYPLTAAAAIIVAFVAWSENRPFILGKPMQPGLPEIAIQHPLHQLDPIEKDRLAVGNLFLESAADDKETGADEKVTRELHAVAVSQDKGDLFGNDW